METGNPGILRMGSLETSAHLPELLWAMLRGSGVGCWPLGIPIAKAPASLLGPSSAHLLSPTLPPLWEAEQRELG